MRRRPYPRIFIAAAALTLRFAARRRSASASRLTRNAEDFASLEELIEVRVV